MTRTFYKNLIVRLTFCVLLAYSGAISIHAQTTAFTYQGKLTDNTLSPTAAYDMQFRLFDAPTVGGGTQQGGTVNRSAVQVTSGVFTVQLDFGDAYYDASRLYLEVSVRPAGGTTYTSLNPRQQITSAPMAVQSRKSLTALNADSADNLNGIPAGDYALVGDARFTDSRSPTAGSSFYIQNNPATAQTGGFNVSGSGTIGNTLSAGAVSANVYRDSLGNIILRNNIAGSTFLGTSAGSSTSPLIAANTFLGNFSGGSTTSGSYNTFVGRAAGDLNQTGNNNTVVGASADVTTTNLSYATAIGANSAVGASDTIVLGKTAGTYSGVIRPADTVLIPGNGSVGGTLNTFNASVGNNLSVQGNITTQGTFNVAGAVSMNTLTVNSTLTAGSFSGVGSNLTGLNAGNITVGTINASRIPTLNASKISGGTFDDALLSSNIPRKNNASNNFTGNLEASDITATGNLAAIGSLSVGGTFFGSTINAGTVSGSTINAGTVSGSTINATTQYNIGGNRVLSASGNVVTVGRATDTTKVGILQITGGSDLAEKFEIGGGDSTDDDAAVKPGMVVAIDPNRAGKLAISRSAYDRRVAGVVSGANNVAAGMVLPDLAEGKNSRAVALSGRVWVYADATRAPIQPGDLLTTSDLPGHAMRADDAQRSQGAILGKAMTELKSGTGFVLILVTLQ